jgi:hypothetical protein
MVNNSFVLNNASLKFKMVHTIKKINISTYIQAI